MNNLADITIWKQSFGLLPIHLKANKSEPNYVMLNGGYGDFCLQTAYDSSNENDYFSKSWSSNTKNFVVIDNDKVRIYNWFKNKPEEILTSIVSNNFNKFYAHLLSKSIKSDRDVVPFIINLFRQFRNITREKTNPVEALNLLFVLLTSLEEINYPSLDKDKWNIRASNIPQGFDSFAETLNRGVNNGVTNIKPLLDLIIRHSAGVLFQEAQKEVLFFNPQLELFGGASGKLITKSNLYSSIHYTPPFLSRTIVEQVIRKVDLSKQKLKIFDPACGSSEFLIEALKQLKEKDYCGEIEIIGWDNSETAVDTSNFLLKYEQRTVWDAKLTFTIKKVTDSLVEVWDNNYDIILMNPPFVSWELLTAKHSKEAVKAILGESVNGKPNLASAFFYKSVQSLNADGLIGCVIPASILTLDAYKKLRNEVYELITINLIGKLGNFVFEDALTDVSFIIGHKPKTNIIPMLLWTGNEKGIAQDALRDLRKMTYNNESSVNEKGYSIFQPDNFPILKESWKPISIKDNQLIKTTKRFVAEKKLFAVSDIFNVQQGIRLGIGNIFKIGEDELAKLPENEKKFFRPVIDNEAIKNGTLNKNNFVWYPYNKDGGVFNNENDLLEKAPKYYNEKLKPNENTLKNRAGISEWWELTRPRNWQFENKEKLISTEFGKSDSFAFDSEGVFVVERGNAWHPKKQFKKMDYYFYLAIFSSGFFDKLLSIYSKQLAGGNWFDLGKMHTREIPIPNVHSEDVKNSMAYEKLANIGKELANGNNYVKIMADEILTKFFYPES